MKKRLEGSLREQLVGLIHETRKNADKSFYEEEVERILEELEAEKMIYGYKFTDHLSKDDLRGIDYWIWVNWWQRVPLQVAGTYSECKKKRNFRNRKGREYIPIVWLRRGEFLSYERVKERVKRIIDKEKRHFGIKWLC